MLCFCFIVRVLFIFIKEKLLLSLFRVVLYDELNFILISILFANSSTDVNDQASQSLKAFYSFEGHTNQLVTTFSQNILKLKGINLLFSWVVLNNLLVMDQYTTAILDFSFLVLVICCLLFNQTIWCPRNCGKMEEKREQCLNLNLFIIIFFFVWNLGCYSLIFFFNFF